MEINDCLKISILVDDPDSWILPYAKEIKKRLSEKHRVKLFTKSEDIEHGDILFLLGCLKIISKNILSRNKNNLVIHESDLPKGRGWSPVAWQVLEGMNEIPIVLFEALEELDAGDIYLKDYIELSGTELLPEIKHKQGLKTIELVEKFVSKWPNVTPVKQYGEETYYLKRDAKDDEIDPRKSIIENFNHLRIVDNEKYPAWFRYKDRKYKLKIYPMEMRNKDK